MVCTVSIYCHHKVSGFLPIQPSFSTYKVTYTRARTHTHMYTHTHSRRLLPPVVHMQEVGLTQYAPYFKNSLAQEAIMKDAGAKFFAETQLRLGDPFTLSSYLVKPFERMARYKLFIVVRW